MVTTICSSVTTFRNTEDPHPIFLNYEETERLQHLHPLLSSHPPSPIKKLLQHPMVMAKIMSMQQTC